jgi:hypothetical protein
MRIRGKRLTAIWVVAACAGSTAAIAQKSYIAAGTAGEITQPALSELWRQPADIASENLFYGPGGEEHQPRGPFTFEKEDLEGTNPKFDVRDAGGVKWKIKLGAEARPETVATRFVWAVGYHADEDYFLQQVQVNGLPAHVHRGQDTIEPGGVLRNVRLKRQEDWKKAANWSWRDNPFKDTAPMYGLRVMMAVISNWDLKDENNAIRDRYFKTGGGEREYEVGDLGASFGSTGRGLTHGGSKGNLQAYSDSKMIDKVGADYVDFNVPTRPAWLLVFDEPEFISRMDLRWIGRGIPRQEARRIGGLLGQLSDAQIRDAFRAGGYEGAELDGFTAAFEKRVAELKRL